MAKIELKFGVNEMTQSTTQSDPIICVDCQVKTEQQRQHGGIHIRLCIV